MDNKKISTKRHIVGTELTPNDYNTVKKLMDLTGLSKGVILRGLVKKGLKSVKLESPGNLLSLTRLGRL